MIRQQHALVSRGGVLADTAAAHFHDLVHSREGRWKLWSTLAAPARGHLLVVMFPLTSFNSTTS